MRRRGKKPKPQYLNNPEETEMPKPHKQKRKPGRNKPKPMPGY